MAMSCGIDWSEDHHDVAVVDADGRLVAKRRIGDDAAGYGQLLEVLAEAGDRPETPIPVAIETARGLLVACLRATGRPIYAINPLAVARYRQRHAVSGKKSDHADAVVLANILRTDRAAHRPLPADSELVRAIAVLARAQQDAVWDRTQAHHKLRSLLREYYPGLLAAFRTARGGILRPEARVLLAAAPTPCRRGPADPTRAGRVAAPGRPPASPACPRRPPARDLRRPLPAAAAAGRAGDGPTRPGAAGCPEHRLRQRRRTRHRDPPGVRPPPRRQAHHQLRRSWPAHRRPGVGRARR